VQERQERLHLGVINDSVTASELSQYSNFLTAASFMNKSNHDSRLYSCTVSWAGAPSLTVLRAFLLLFLEISWIIFLYVIVKIEVSVEGKIVRPKCYWEIAI